MSFVFRAVRGTKDILPDEAEYLRHIEVKAREISSLYGYREVITPVIENRDLFVRSLGKDTEVIGKQMFIIERGDDIIALRPEATAGVIRAYLENNLNSRNLLAKFYYFGPMFRAERPQKGRLRQFHHLGVEAVGSSSPLLDVEIISLAEVILKNIGISGFKIKINTLGCVEDKKAFAEKLRVILGGKISDFCQDCRERFDRNVFRLLDCKNSSCKNIILGLNIKRTDYLCGECLEHFDTVLAGLKNIGVNYEESAHLVRGLDYYTRTVFEITHSELGAQDAVGAGGRYDNLVEELGGEPTAAIGFAFGVERLLLVSSAKCQVPSKDLVFLIALGKGAEAASVKLLYSLRQNGIKADTLYEEKSLKGAMRRANDLGAKYVLILGENELKKNVVVFKDMASGEQREIKTEEVIAELMALAILKAKPLPYRLKGQI
ncbi:MAG: histidine--tRNA ligase [Candidatus Omnitrophota bacterium]|nr:histidine--tRNA ligase [Candidatus Omnitrophota bacterium]